jgi:hypothetical protein
MTATAFVGLRIGIRVVFMLDAVFVEEGREIDERYHPIEWENLAPLAFLNTLRTLHSQPCSLV